MKHFEVKLQPTERTLHIFVGEYNQKEMSKICGLGIHIESNWQGAYITHEIGTDIEPIMWIKDPKSNATFIHETVHCVTDIMKITGIKDDEFRAWYTEWLYNTIQDAKKLSK